MTDKIETLVEEYRGHQIELTWFYDIDCDAPWENEDGHGPVSEWTSREKHPGERILWEDDRGNKLFYDFAEAIKLAKKDGWDAPPYKTGTKGQQALRAVEADYQWLRRYCRNDWYYVGYSIKIDGSDYDESLWGIDSDSMKEFSAEAIKTAKAWLDRELTETADAACRDIVTA